MNLNKKVWDQWSVKKFKKVTEKEKGRNGSIQKKRSLRWRPIIIYLSIILAIWVLYGLLPMAVASATGQNADEGDNCCWMFIVIVFVLIFQLLNGLVMMLLFIVGIAVILAILFVIVYAIIRIVKSNDRKKND